MGGAASFPVLRCLRLQQDLPRGDRHGDLAASDVQVLPHICTTDLMEHV